MHQTSKVQSFQRSFEVVQDRHAQIREAVEVQLRGAALALITELFEEELTALCGASFQRKAGYLAYRGGSDRGTVMLQGQRVGVRKPRIRRNGKEVELSTHRALQGLDLLGPRVVAHMLSGVSTRRYDGLLDAIAGGLGLKRSSVSRAFVRGSRQALEAINGKDLSKERWLVLMIDSLEFAERTVTVALGIAAGGKKHVLGLREGHTENAEVVTNLLSSLADRGFPSTPDILLVLDGAKALRKGVRRVFGDLVPIQRCIRHKERNVLSYLPQAHHAELRRRWKMIHGLTTHADAQKEMERLVRWLAPISQAAVSSLEEAEGETLTVLRFGIPEKLRKTLLSTNPIESAFDGVRSASRRVKNWRKGVDQIVRWAAATLNDVERRFRRVKGFRELPLLAAELDKIPLLQERKVA